VGGAVPHSRFNWAIAPVAARAERKSVLNCILTGLLTGTAEGAGLRDSTVQKLDLEKGEESRRMRIRYIFIVKYSALVLLARMPSVCH